MVNNVEINMFGSGAASNAGAMLQPPLQQQNWFAQAALPENNNQGFQLPTQAAGQDPSHGNGSINPNAQAPGNLVATFQPSSSSSNWPINAGQQLTSMLTPQYQNQASLLELKARLLQHAGGDAALNKTEGAKALRISEQQMDMIIKNLGGEDATSVSVQKVMEHFEEYANNDSLRLITDNGINQAIMDMMGGLGNFKVWAGEDDHINQNEFWGLVQALQNGLTVNDQQVSIERPQANIIHEQIAGSDGLIDRNEFALLAPVQEDGTFNWEDAQTQLAQRAAAVGQSGSGNNQGQGGSGGHGLAGAHPQPNNNWNYTENNNNNNSGGTGTNYI
ncbi:MAG: hypothetical protein JJU21_18245 [Salinarimonas sp.]|nr:hypothetical protein [Salinarimonas sp.]